MVGRVKRGAKTSSLATRWVPWLSAQSCGGMHGRIDSIGRWSVHIGAPLVQSRGGNLQAGRILGETIWICICSGIKLERQICSIYVVTREAKDAGSASQVFWWCYWKHEADIPGRRHGCTDIINFEGFNASLASFSVPAKLRQRLSPYLNERAKSLLLWL